jgi:hypothetical protein
VLGDPILSAEIEALASEIAGKGASPEIQMLSRRIAQAQIDLRRVRYVRHELLAHALTNLDYGSRASVKAEYDMPVPFSRGTGLVTPVPEQITRVFGWKRKGPPNSQQVCPMWLRNSRHWTGMSEGLCRGGRVQLELSIWRELSGCSIPLNAAKIDLDQQHERLADNVPETCGAGPGGR